MSCLSISLDALVNSWATESLEAYVTWEGVDVDIFSLFAQFDYTGAYTRFAPPWEYGPDKATYCVSTLGSSALVEPLIQENNLARTNPQMWLKPSTLYYSTLLHRHLLPPFPLQGMPGQF
jgi:hypothetical protein